MVDRPAEQGLGRFLPFYRLLHLANGFLELTGGQDIPCSLKRLKGALNPQCTWL